MGATQTVLGKYDAYKDSSEDWLGEIPEHWEVTRLGGLLKPVSIKGKPEEQLLSITRELGVIIRDIEDDSDNHNFIPDDLSNYKLLTKGQFGMNKMKAWQGSYGVSNFNGIVSPAYYVFDFTKEVDGSFFNWAIRSKRYVSYFGEASDGVRIGQWDLSKDRMKKIPFILPPLPEQTAIATFLDEKTAKIDRAIAQKERLIELLKERKQILIRELVTGKKVWDEATQSWVKPKETVDSGVEWIGEIPKGWEVMKLFGLCRFVRGNSTFSKDELLSKGEFVALQYGKTYKVNEVDTEYEFYVDNEFYKESQVVNYGDTIFISTSETIEDLGHTVFYNRNDLGLLGGEQILIKPKSEKIISQYLHFSARVFSKELRKYATGVKVFRFNTDDLKTIYSPVPPLNGQNIIFEHINLQSKKIDQVIFQNRSQITKLKEYKSVLIDSAVTGKIKVY